MAFNTKEQEIIKWGLENGKTKEQVKEAIANYRLGIQPVKTTPKEEGYSFGELGQDIAQTGKEIYSATEKAQETIGKAKGAYVRGEQGLLETGAQALGTSAGLISNSIGSVIKGLVKAALPQSAETGIKKGVEAVAEPIMGTETVKNVISYYNSLDEKTKRNVDAALGAGSLALDVVGLKAGGKAIEESGKLGVKALKTGSELVETGAKTIKPGLETAGKFASGVRTIAESTGETIKKIPGRIATNVAKTKATAETIKKLPTQIARDAVQNGVDIDDIKYLYKLPVEAKEPLKKLFQATKDFASGASKTNPIEVVGKPIVERIKTLRTSVTEVGQKLGKAAENLGIVTRKELTPKILESLQKVPGLQGLKISKKGLLDFSDTVLASSETLADRRAIQRIFIDAVKSGTGKQKHLLRQELFEVLGGKKGAQVAMTATQDKAYQAIRKGLSDILDMKNDSYKALNAEYAKMAQPLQAISKFMKLNKLMGASDDILNMDAGLLVRRLTSNAASNPEIRNLFRALDNATKVAGKTTLSVENLQDFYNLLDKYYNLAGKTTLQKQVQLGVEKAGGWKDALSQTVEQIAGKSDAVKRKAIEDAINEALGFKQGAIPTTISKGISKIDDTLTQEARKYKSAEEFVKAQGTPVYHHGATELKIKGGTWFTNNDISAGGARAGAKGRIDAVIDESNLKLANNKQATEAGLYRGKEEMIKNLKAQGFDGVKHTVDGDKHYMIFDEGNIKTKSQLTDIYNQAVKGTKKLGQPKILDINQFERSKDITGTYKEIESRAFEKIIKEEDEILKDYIAKSKKTVNADDFKNYFDDVGYTGENSAAVQEPSSYLAKRAMTINLNKNPEPLAGFYAGSSGSGKTSAINTLEDLIDLQKQSANILDSNLSNPSAIGKIQEAIDVGKQPFIAFVARKPMDALHGVISRMFDNPAEAGRLVPTKIIAQNMIGSWRNVSEVIPKKFPGIKQYFIDNFTLSSKTHPFGDPKFISLEEMANKLNYQTELELRKMFNQEITKLFKDPFYSQKIYGKGNIITPEQYKKFTS